MKAHSPWRPSSRGCFVDKQYTNYRFRRFANTATLHPTASNSQVAGSGTALGD
jgi:hypothetical protein